MTLYVFGSSRVEGEPSRSVVEVYIKSMAVDRCLPSSLSCAFRQAPAMLALLRHWQPVWMNIFR
jgi:hypothetical protein